MRRAYLPLMALLLISAGLVVDAEAQEGIPIPPVGAPAEETPNVTVEAPEPIYVAPTLRDRIGRIWAPVVINGKGPYRLVLDTGATSSAVIPSVIESLGMTVPESSKLRINGMTGSAVVSFVTADQIEVGDLLIQDVRLPIVADVFGGAQGVLGANGFRDTRIFIDFNHDLIRISRSRSQRTPVGYTRVPLLKNKLQLPMFDVVIGRVKTKAILDTGAQSTVGNDSLRAALRRSQEGRDEEIVGVTLDVAQGTSLPIPTITLGENILIRNMRASFGTMFIFEHWNLTNEPVLVLGMDVIGTLESMVIDYKLRELHLRARH